MVAPKLSPELMSLARQMMPEVARRQALDRPLAQVKLSRIYAVAGWESEELALAQNISDIKTAEDFAATLEQDDADTLLVRRAACPSLAALTSALNAAGGVYTVFYEYAQ